MEDRGRNAEQVEVKAQVEGRRPLLLLRLSLNLGVMLLVGWMGFHAPTIFSQAAWADSSSSSPSAKLKGNVARGREIFNGKGACYYCHGIDGYFHRVPRLDADTDALIARLNPPPPNLRDLSGLRLKTNKERARAIREGHPGTGMFPDLTMTDQDIADVLMYLALMRKDPNPMAD